MKHTVMMVKMTRDQKPPRTVLLLIDQFVVTILCPFSYPERTDTYYVNTNTEGVHECLVS